MTFYPETYPDYEDLILQRQEEDEIYDENPDCPLLTPSNRGGDTNGKA